MPGNGDVEERSHQLHRRVAWRNTCFASATAPAQNQVTEHRQVVVPADRGAAGGTFRVGKDDRFFTRQTMNHNIEKAANNCPEDAGDYVRDGPGNGQNVWKRYQGEMHAGSIVYRRLLTA